eukprot:SM004746S16491  [mRNA]  locus=s4746:138:1046:- [translate_table: standard]
MSAPRKRSFKIEPFKHKVEMDPRYADKTWKVLEDAIHEIYRHNAGGLSFEELYRNAYNMVLHKYGEKLYSGLVATMTTHLQRTAREVEGAEGRFLEELDSRWNKAPVHELGLALWRDHVVRAPPIRDRLRSTLLGLVHAERRGEVINRYLMRSATKMLADLGPSVYQ